MAHRIAALERVARGLSREGIALFTQAVKDAAPGTPWPTDARYWYSGTAGVSLTSEETDALSCLWSRMLVGLAFAATHENIEAWVARPSLLGKLDRLVEPRRSHQLEGRATTVLEGSLGGDVWRGVIGIWNAFCAALLQQRLDSTLRDDLERTWLTVKGAPLRLEDPPSLPS